MYEIDRDIRKSGRYCRNGKRVRENRVFKTDRRKKNLLILGLEDREVNTIDRELCEMKWKIFFISILAFFFYEIKFRYSIFEYTNTRLLLFNFDSFFFFPPPVKKQNRIWKCNFYSTLFIYFRTWNPSYPHSVQRILLHLTSFQTRFPRKRILTRENVIPSFQLISTCRITLNFDCTGKNHWKLFLEKPTYFQKLDIFKKKKRRKNTR